MKRALVTVLAVLAIAGTVQAQGLTQPGTGPGAPPKADIAGPRSDWCGQIVTATVLHQTTPAGSLVSEGGVESEVRELLAGIYTTRDEARARARVVALEGLYYPETAPPEVPADYYPAHRVRLVTIHEGCLPPLR